MHLPRNRHTHHHKRWVERCGGRNSPGRVNLCLPRSLHWREIYQRTAHSLSFGAINGRMRTTASPTRLRSVICSVPKHRTAVTKRDLALVLIMTFLLSAASHSPHAPIIKCNTVTANAKEVGHQVGIRHLHQERSVAGTNSGTILIHDEADFDNLAIGLQRSRKMLRSHVRWEIAARNQNDS